MKILSFGEIIWDVYPDKAVLGGAPLNFAAHATVWGSETHLLSAVGGDSLGRRAIGEIEKLGVSVRDVSVSDKALSGRCNVILNENGVPRYEIDPLSAYDLIQAPECLSGYDIFSFGTLALRHEENRVLLRKILSEGSFSEVFTDLNIRPPFYSRESIELCLAGATVVKISDEDGAFISEALFSERQDVKTLAVALTEKYPNIKLILVTLGENGSLCYDSKTKEFTRVDAVKTEVVSTVGAGDSYGATFIVNYLKTGDIKRAMELAATVSAYVVSKKGAIPEGTREYVNSIIG